MTAQSKIIEELEAVARRNATPNQDGFSFRIVFGTQFECKHSKGRSLFYRNSVRVARATAIAQIAQLLNTKP
ncbi:hypothetical protein BJP27_24450 (plasmid) [Pseudomonas oryzihabitans]|nr:hypothetical protein BJP27_24450 [Pseudomonas psychrotolerans]